METVKRSMVAKRCEGDWGINSWSTEDFQNSENTLANYNDGCMS